MHVDKKFRGQTRAVFLCNVKDTVPCTMLKTDDGQALISCAMQCCQVVNAMMLNAVLELHDMELRHVHRCLVYLSLSQSRVQNRMA